MAHGELLSYWFGSGGNQLGADQIGRKTVVDGPAAGETLVDLVPVFDAFLPEPPAELNFPALILDRNFVV